MTYSDARDMLVRRALSTPVPAVEPGSSAYFSKPSSDFDPRLFSPGSDRLQVSVSTWILNTLYEFWAQRGLLQPMSWSTVWIAGSGITHQWAAARGGIGDLDVLIGVDFNKMRSTNPRYQGFNDDDIAAILNDEFKAILDPVTANWHGFEVTFYVNADSKDIRNINPYAAYNVTRNTWTVRPINIPTDWDVSKFPQQWWDAVGEEEKAAKTIVARYRAARAQARTKGPERVNAAVALEQAVKDGAGLFNDIHLSRRLAFNKEGRGYLDWYNFRWQAHKRNGVVPALHAMANLLHDAHQQSDTALYGRVLLDSAAATRAAALSSALLDRIVTR